MFTLIFFYLLLNSPLLMMNFIPSRCFWRMKNEEKYRELVEACFFFLYTVQWSVEKDYFSNLLDTLTETENRSHFLWFLAFSLHEINRNPDFLPNISLVFRVPYCLNVSLVKDLIHISQPTDVTHPNYDCTKGVICTVLLTGPNWEASVLYHTFMSSHEPQQILHLTYGPFHPLLNDRVQFSYIYKLAHEDKSLAMALVAFLLYLNCNWVGLAISDNEQGTQFLSYLKREMEKDTICFAFVNMIPLNMEVYISRAEVYYNQIMTSSTNVVILYGDTDSTLAVAFRMWKTLGIQRTWITTSEWDVPTSKRDLTLDPFHGNLAFAQHYGKISGFKIFVQTLNPLKYSDKYLARLNWMNFNCEASASNCKTMKNCSTNFSLEWLMTQIFDTAFSGSSYDIYNASYVLAHVIYEVPLQQVENQPIDNEKKYDHICSKMYSLMKKTHFTSPTGDKVTMNQKEKLQKEYDIFYIWNLPHDFELKVKIGKFSLYFPHGQQVHSSEDMLEWATRSRQMLPSVCSAECDPGFRRFRQEGMSACCFTCTNCPENEISNGTNMDQCVKCPEDQYANTEQNHCIPKAVICLSYEDPLGMALALMALGFSALTALVLGVFLRHNDTAIVKANNRSLSYILLMSLMFCFLCSLLFIGQPNSATCILQQITFGIVFTVAISCVLAKTITVVLAFNVTAPARRMMYILVSGALNYIIPLCTLIQIILCSIWLGASPPSVDIDAYSEHGHIIIVCHKGSVIAFYCVLGYLGCLALGSFTVAFLARNLPDTFNEAKFLTFSMLVFCTVWITFLPVYHSTKGKVMVTVEIFSIMASSAGMLGCIFVPKCYIILLRPDKNSLQKIREKSYS
ncbi:vomeronasal type-2 receptor 116-like [Acomys russatus]|uniref:vomeronasal type-2 receptor 116-like n=1 Tax=Acomys russatus TaxID=60746 RepID=UPI0021E21CF1|nr:vomeronasal type-2 receptor 116-like [Acomys russatus]